MAIKDILIFNEDSEEKLKILDLLHSDEFNIFETPRVLEVIHLLKTKDISLVIASHKLSPTENTDFKALVETIKPGISVLFVNPLANGNGVEGVNLSSVDFRHFLQDSLQTESFLNSQLTNFKDFFLSFTDRLIQIFSATNKYFFNKDQLVSRLSRRTAFKMGLDREMADNIQIAALLKDLGMLGIQQQLLEEKKKFNSHELMSIKKHPMNCVQILKQINFPWNVDAIILQHHENYDGSGYPMGIKGRQISIGGRIVHIADSFVAMTTERPYRQALTKDEAVKEIMKNTGTQFDPEIVEIFLSIINEEMPSEGAKRNILLLEQSPSISPMIKLIVDAGEFDVKPSYNSQEAIENIRRKVPNLIIAEMDMIKQSSFVQFFNVMYEIPFIQECPFIFVLPDDKYPRDFKGSNIFYVTKPIDIEELTSCIKSVFGEEPEHAQSAEESKGLRGTLNDFNLAEIIQILHLGLKTARVDMADDRKKGCIHIARGNVIQATMGDLSGKEALFDLMAWNSGNFHIQHGLSTKETNITTDTMHLLLEAAKIQDEAEDSS
jgi:HD-GYP domain-containing protein (c-di-GMP phosphodiesterase class II)